MCLDDNSPLPKRQTRTTITPSRQPPAASLLSQIAVCVLSVLFIGSAVAALLYHQAIQYPACAKECKKSDSDLIVTLKTPQQIKYIKPKPTNHIYDQHITAVNVSHTDPILVALVKDKESVFILRMTLTERSKDDGPIVSMWLG